ncbi:AAA family ATPase [Nocardia sp. SYP-A9097]|nr:AAA family ATPase [Nocardia sp. SYP-A9097]
MEGPAGIGKSRLLGEFARREQDRGATTGLRVVSVPATEFEHSTPLQLVHDILDRISELPDPASTRDDCSDPRELARLLRRRLGTEPTLLVIDDAHWADTASLHVLALLIRHRPDGTRLALAYRERQFPAALGHALRTLGTATFHLPVPPLSIADAAALLPELPSSRRERLLSAAHGNPLYLLLLAELTPAEFDTAVRSGDPASTDCSHLDRTIRAELAQLPDRELLAAAAAAVCGPTADADLLCATAELPLEELSAALDELARRGWLTITGGTVTFRHPLIRTAAYRLGGPGWRAGAHARAARTLRAADAPLLTRARHLEHALRGRDDLAATELIHAAELALPTDPATSARWITAALAAGSGHRTADLGTFDTNGSGDTGSGPHSPGPDRPTDASHNRPDRNRLAANDFDSPNSGAHRRVRDDSGPDNSIPASTDSPAATASRSHENWPSPGDSGPSGFGSADCGPGGVARVRIQHLLGRALLLSGAVEQAREVLEPLAARAGSQQQDSLLLYARCERILGNVDTARSRLATVADRPDLAGNGPVQLELAILELQDNRDVAGAARVRALFGSEAIREPAILAAALTLWSMGQLTELDMAGARANYQAGEREYTRLTDTQLLDSAHAVSALGWMAYFLDDQRTGLAHIERAVRVTRRFGRSFILPELYTVQAYSLAKLGRNEEALTAAEDAAECAELYGYPGILPLAGAIKLRVLHTTSPRAQVLEWWRTVDAMPRPVMRWWRAVVESALNEIAARLGIAAAKPAAAQPDRAHPMQPTEVGAFAQVLLGKGDIETAGRLVTQAEKAAQGLGLSGQLAAAAHARAEYACARADLDRAETAAQAAIEGYAVAEMPIQRAQAQLIAARVAGQRGDFGRATALIATARTEFTRAGTHELLIEATAAQRQLAGRQSVTGALALTEREREVAGLVARGCTNKEIAAQLFLSPRTVEDHLSRILRKLGLSSRAGIAQRLSEVDAKTL